LPFDISQGQGEIHDELEQNPDENVENDPPNIIAIGVIDVVEVAE